jgi:DNA-binding transcriptional LysR family regulator
MAVYPHRRHLAGKVRALIDHLVAWFEAHPV